MFALKPVPVLLLIILSFLYNAVTAQVSCVPVFIKEYKGTGDIMPAAVKALPGGTFIVAGKGSLNIGGPYDGAVTHVSASGDILWSFLIGGAGHDEFTGVTPLDDGGFLLYGFTRSFGYPEGKAWLVRIDNTGSLIWSRQLGSSTGADRIKAVQQFSDGDIIGTFNTNDATASSNPVVFKMALDGTLRWAQTFDHGQNDSFTSIAFSGNIIYAAGFYSINTRRAVIVKLNSADGSLIASTNMYKRDETYDHEIVGLEVRNNIISYGLWMYERRNFPGYNLNAIILVQTDLADNNLFTLHTSNGGDTMTLIPYRTPDNGFVILSPGRGSNGEPFVVKIGPYGYYNEWGNVLARYFHLETRHAIDITADGGCIAAGYYKINSSPATMNMMRINANGENGSCKIGYRGLHPDTTSYARQSFSWQLQTAMVPAINEVVVPSRLSMASTRTTFCETSFCTDHTPLPPGCNKNYNLQFSAVKPIIVRDAVSTTDGGKLVVGDQHFNGLAIKYNENGDVAWSKQYETYFHESRFMRVIRTFDNNYLIFANRSISINSTGYSHMSMIKVDINGNVIWVRDLNERGGNRPLGTMADVTETPDGGFVLLVNGLYTSQAIRYDQNLNVIWKKEFVGVFNPVYKTVYYSNGAVYLQYQNPFLISTTSFGIEKLDLLTGNRIWSNIYTAGGPNSSVLLNRVFAINDTVYAFVTHKVPNASFDAASPVMVKLNPDGSLASSVQFQGDNIPPSPYFYTNEYDKNPPTVAITPYNDFVLTSRVAAGTDSLLRLARIGTEGTVAWSRVYNSSKYHHPFNIHTQGKGIVVMGAVMNRPTDPIQYFFTDAFLIKTDSSGQLITGGAGSCTSTDRPLAPVPISFSVAPAGHTLQDVQNYTLSNGSISSMDFAVDATLLCSTPANCNTVTLKQRGTGCSLGDTLVYYLEDNADCDAAAAWHYDTAFFKAVHMNGDSIRIVPKKTGAFTINARIEGNCMITTQSITSSMGLSASQLALGNDALICDRQQIKLSAGRGYVTYKWNDNSTDSTLIITKPGKYYVDVTDNCGGAGTDTVLITAAGLVFKIAGNNTKCNSDTVLLQASAGYYNYQWSPKQNLQATSDRALVCPATTTRYYATAEKWPGCTLIDSILITTLVSPPVNLPGDSQLCTGDSMLVQAAAGFDTYQWNTGETQPAIKVRTPGSYLVTATFNNGCQSKDTFLLGWYPNPAPSLNKNSVLCAGSTRLLEPAQQYDGYLWSDGSTAHSMEINTTGSYWVTVTDGQGCKGADTTHVTTIAPLPAGFLPADTAICQYGKLTILPVHNYRSYLWSDLSISSSLTVKKSGLYWVTVTDQNGCSGSDSILVGSKQCLEGFYVPNAFTPNGDKQNEIFRPLIFGNLTSITFMVYNRWGGKVYETHDPSSGWNGKINARDAEKGTYVWMCRYTFTGQPEKIEKGIVELIR